MMSTPSSTARSATATSPQVTASVVKFHCLYTHDLRRKSKRWQDGYLRYHKFNKRIMVYDDHGNFIGDHHWRSNDEVQDGDELELDKGVLIQVTECTGTSETDITNLYEKRKSSQGSPQIKAPMSQAPRPAASIRSSGSQSFRSLNDLLNIKKPPIGHLSPYEQRNPPQKMQNTQEPIRPAKRQKTTTAVPANPGRTSRLHSQVIDLTELNPAVPLRQETEKQTEIEPPSSGGFPEANAYPTVRAATRTVAPKPTLPQRPNPPTATRSPVVDAPQMTRNRPQQMVPPHTAPKATRPAASNDIHQNTPQPMQSQRSDPVATRVPVTAPEMSNSRPTSGQIPLTTPKAVQSATPVNNLAQGLPQPQRLNRTELSRPSAPTRPEISLAQERTTTDEPVTRATDRPNNVSNPMQPGSGPLTASRQPPLATSKPLTTRSLPIGSVHTNNKNTEPPKPTNEPASKEMPPPSRPSPGVSAQKPTTSLRMGTAKPRRKLMYSALLPGDILQKSSSPPTRTPPDPKPRETASTSQELQFTRPVVPSTENLGTANEDFMPSQSTQFIFDEMLDGSGFKPPSAIRNVTGRRSLDSPLRKSLSDPTTLISRKGHQARSNLTRSSSTAADQENQPKEEGPWTSEALDLFDFWPAGRHKPT
ncbi:uncharacterized protein N7511_000457 [Penicillium nucicola]|uniref:uncharacterized protein n=1 Tax=Penicillium nucicola TaxID=1850975 RepID=UPI002545487A|nr:uncharacterized protein N7511_000457 [Penicillium nucicola]KAJ5775446.1 hypothetical protein N7511_000457 [Penicillium nucicola]